METIACGRISENEQVAVLLIYIGAKINIDNEHLP